MLQRIHWHATTARPLWNAQASRSIEQAALTHPQHPSLMQRAGQAIADLTRTVAPQARQAWVLCGPGNNGGDGLVAASHLARRGLKVGVHWLGNPDACSDDTHAAWQQARQTPVEWLSPHATPSLTTEDVVIDALLGLGQRARSDADATPLQQLLQRSYTSAGHSIAVDLPTGLDTDHGTWLPGYTPPETWQPSSRHTLSLLTLKPGLFTAHGRDACGDIWWDDLECTDWLQQQPPSAWLGGPAPQPRRRHNSHKGSFGDVLVIGGAPGMVGAAILAASAALHHGAGRTLLHLLNTPEFSVYPPLPDLMLPDADSARGHLAHATVVCGCGGGQAVHAWLPAVLEQAPRLVLDADALNALARDEALHHAVQARRARGHATILTPHPLEAARLLRQSTAEVQAERLTAAQTLADNLQCTVLLKGSGSIIASPGETPHINPTGNPRLAIGGTGDVLAGILAARWQADLPAHAVASQAAWEHGTLADQWPAQRALIASALAQAQLQSL